MKERSVKAMKEELVLDCESFDAALQSLAQVFNCNPAVLRQFLANPEIGAYYEANCDTLPDFREYLYLVVEKHFGPASPLDAVCWFHTTRVAPGTSFSEGILPLGAVLPQLKVTLIEIAEDIEVKQNLRAMLAADSVADHHYQNKTTDELHWGPYAILVRDVAFCASRLSQHDYLGMPEIIEDICNGASQPLSSKLTTLFERRLKPTIVKFKNVFNDDERCISTALCYVSACIHDGKPDGNSVYCFDGENVPVSPANILKVEHVELNP